MIMATMTIMKSVKKRQRQMQRSHHQCRTQVRCRLGRSQTKRPKRQHFHRQQPIQHSQPYPLKQPHKVRQSQYLIMQFSDFLNFVFVFFSSLTESRELKCPKSCKCSDTFDFVDCSHQKLVQIPKNLPHSTVQLNLSHNLLTTLNVSDLIKCSDLRQLLLNDNQIETIVNTDVSIFSLKKKNVAFILITFSW